jgi:hypothetical protein
LTKHGHGYAIDHGSDRAAPGWREQLGQPRRIAADDPDIRELAPQIVGKFLVDFHDDQAIRRQSGLQQGTRDDTGPTADLHHLGPCEIGYVARHQTPQRCR